MSRWIWISVAVVAGFGGATIANAEIYRCLHEQTVVFSDRPCGENAETYASEYSISVVEAPQGLQEIAEENRVFLLEREQRKQVLLAAARERRQRAEEQQLHSRQASEQIQFVAVYPRRFDQPGQRPDSDQKPPPVEPDEPISDRARILASRSLNSGRNINLRPVQSR